MVTFRNNNNLRRNNFRRNDRNYKSNADRPKFNTNFSNNENFKRKLPGRNNHNASKLIEKYNDLAREATSNGDKILSENYLQHADHFTRILNEQESFRRAKLEDKTSEKLQTDNSDKDSSAVKDKITEEIKENKDVKEKEKSQQEAN